MIFSDESDACRVSGGSSKCPCQDGYEGDPCRGECQSKLALFVLTNIVSELDHCSAILHWLSKSQLY